MSRSTADAPRLTLAQTIVAVKKGDLTAWRILLRYDTKMIDVTSGFHDSFLEHFLIHCLKFYPKHEDFLAAYKDIIRANKEARRSPIVGPIPWDNLFKDLVQEECVSVVKHVVRHYLDDDNASTIGSALLKSLSYAKSEGDKGDIFLALPTSAEFDAKELFTKMITNGGAKQLAEVVDRVSAKFEKHEILVGLGAALGVAEEKDRGTIISLISTVSADGFDFRAETAKRKTPPPPPPPSKKSVGGSSSAAAPDSSSFVADDDDEEDDNESEESGDEGEKSKKKTRKEKRKLKPDGNGGWLRPMGRAPKLGHGKDKTWDSKNGKWI